MRSTASEQGSGEAGAGRKQRLPWDAAARAGHHLFAGNELLVDVQEAEELLLVQCRDVPGPRKVGRLGGIQSQRRRGHDAKLDRPGRGGRGPQPAVSERKAEGGRGPVQNGGGGSEALAEHETKLWMQEGKGSNI